MTTRIEPTTERGWTILTLSNDRLQITVVPGKGGDVLSLRRAGHDEDLLWSTPWGLRPQGSTAVGGNTRAQSTEAWPGGWQSLFPNGGDSATTRGVEWPENGEACTAPYDWEPIEGAGVRLRTRLVRSPFRVTREITLDEDTVVLTETVRNDAGEPVEVMWGQQLTFAAPLVGPDTVFECGASLCRPDTGTLPSSKYSDVMPWPRTMGKEGAINLHDVPAADLGETRKVYLSGFTSPTATLTNRVLGLQVELEWDSLEWPHLWYHLEAGGQTDFPWFGSGYFLALGPNSSWPAHGVHTARRIEDTTVWIDPDEERTATCKVTVRETS